MILFLFCFYKTYDFVFKSGSGRSHSCYALKKVFINNLVVRPVYVQCLPIDHKLGHFRQIVRNFPIDIIPGKCGDRSVRSWDLMTTTLDLPKSFFSDRFRTLARAALSVIPFPPLLLTSSNEKSTSGSSPFRANTQVSPQLSISFPSMGNEPDQPKTDHSRLLLLPSLS